MTNIVHSLMSALQDDQLEHHVQDVFIQFGDCFTKIKRDKGGMPYAFVQYYVSTHLAAKRSREADDHRTQKTQSKPLHRVEVNLSPIVHVVRKSRRCTVSLPQLVLASCFSFFGS